MENINAMLLSRLTALTYEIMRLEKRMKELEKKTGDNNPCKIIPMMIKN